MSDSFAMPRRDLLRALTLGSAGATLAWPAWARAVSPGTPAPLPTVSGPDIALSIGRVVARIDGKVSRAVGVNGSEPGPLIRLKEGQTARLHVTNTLDEPSSIHWHGLLVPFTMDGVPGVSFPGIAPRSTFTYEFPVRQSGTYWYHSHSGYQEQDGLYGPIVVEPAAADPEAYDREHVLLLSDHSPLGGATIFRKLKQMGGGYFNEQRMTLAGLLAGRDLSAKERREWARMRMDPTDIADVTGSTYAFTVNGRGPADNWTGLFHPGERVRLRIINAASQSAFNIRIPGLPMTVVHADGQAVRPVTVDELQIGVAETYDVIVTPGERAYSFVSEATDRSGLGRATLAPRAGMTAPVPPLRARPLLTMADMGMAAMAGMEIGPMKMRDPAVAPGVSMGPGVQTLSPMPTDRTAEPPLGLEGLDHRVLTYRDLVALAASPDARAPTRSLDIHLTGNMERYMWSFDGVKMSDPADPIPFRLGERVRVTLVNDTMMQHPIHLHGHFFELVTGHGGNSPRKHSVNVPPGGRMSIDLTADAEGDWAFHCHNLYHMMAGMMRVVTVRGGVVA